MKSVLGDPECSLSSLLPKLSASVPKGRHTTGGHPSTCLGADKKGDARAPFHSDQDTAGPWVFANRSLAGAIFPQQTFRARLGTRFAGDQPACATRLCVTSPRPAAPPEARRVGPANSFQPLAARGVLRSWRRGPAVLTTGNVPFPSVRRDVWFDFILSGRAKA